jgi:hypothetical protein
MSLLKVTGLNQFYGQSHTLWGEPRPTPLWSVAARRTPGKDAGPDRAERDVSVTPGSREAGGYLC